MHTYDIIDIHDHIYKEKIAAKAVDAIGQFYDIPMLGLGTPADLHEKLQKAGITKAVVHSAATTPKQVSSINDFIYEQAQSYPEFIGFGTMHPDFENMQEEIERMCSMGFKGIKLHPDFQCFDIDSPQAMKMYEAFADRFIVLFHVGDKKLAYSSPDKLERVLEHFPDMPVIAAHLGGYSVWNETRLLGKNVYIDTSSTLFAVPPEEAAEMIHRHGVEKVLYGTDYPMWLPEEELERFMAIPLTEEERRLILHDNACRLLGSINR